MQFETLIALRYLRGHGEEEEGSGFLRFMVFVATGGVALGVAALLLSLAIVRGFSAEIEAKIIGFGAHIQVEHLEDRPLEDAAALEAQLLGVPGVAQADPIVQEFVLLRRTADTIEGVILNGVRSFPGYLATQLDTGTVSFAADDAGRAGVVIGRDLAETLGVRVGDPLTAFSVRGLRGGTVGDPSGVRAAPFVVTGIYETSLADFDALNVYTDLAPARRLLAYAPDDVTRLDVMVADPTRIDTVASAIESGLDFSILARSIYDVYPGIFAWVELQEGIIPLVIGVIVLVAAFNIIGILLMIMLEKTREIGVLGSLGASPRAVRRLFVRLGGLIGIVGTLVGSALAVCFALLQSRYGLIRLPAEAYYMSTAPVELNPFDFVIVVAVTLGLCVLAAYLPARAASRIDPIRVIRFE